VNHRETRIPIANIFYMLAYAWNVTPLSWQKKIVDESDYKTLWELLARLLVESIDGIFKRGLSKDYVLIEETIFGVKGQLDPGKTHRRLAWLHAKTCCSYDEFQSDIPVNQAIKATIYRMLRSTNFDLETKTRICLKKLYQRFNGITLVEYGTRRVLANVRLQRHQGHYSFPLALCRFVLDNTVFNEDNGKYQFLDFEREHQKMSTLFEAFIRNYYKKHLKEWTVRQETIKWLTDSDGIGKMYLPQMKTDITLESPLRKIVIEIKFWQDPMQRKKQEYREKYSSVNLYQLNAYLTNLEMSKSHPCNKIAEGLLLYPVLQPIPRMDVTIRGHRFRVESINLNQEWKKIGESLEQLLC